MKQKRINLGSGSDYITGWINVDVDTTQKVDLVADLQEPFPFEDNYANELLASDILEHFTKEDGETFLQECYRVLKQDGIITIRTHNIFQIFKQFNNDPWVLIHFLYGNTEKSGVFGAHKYAYTKETVTHILQKIGFKILRFDYETTNFVIVAKKKKKKIKKLHISVIQQSPDIGGAETYMTSLMREWKKNGSQITFVTNSEKLSLFARQAVTTIYRIPMILDIMGNYRGLIKTILLLPYALFFYVRLLKKLKQQGVDVILMSGFTEKMLVSWLSLFFHIPVVWIEYGRLETIFTRNFYIPKIVYRLTKHIPASVIVPTRNTQESLIQSARVSLAKLRVIPCGTVISKKIMKSPIKEQWKDTFVIGNVSRLTTTKGQQILIKAMSIIVKKIPNARCVIIGGGPDQAYFETVIKKLHMEQYITMTDFVPDVHEYYAAMDVFVFPTVWELEGFGVVLIEAMAHKLPVVASNYGPVPEVVDEQTGILVPPADEKALAKEIIVLAKNRKKRKKLGENGYQKAKKMYTIEKISKDIHDILLDATYV